MATPIEGLSALLVASSDLPAGTSIYPGPTNQIVAPAVVIRPDEPWLEPGGHFCYDLQRYVAIPLVSASSPEDGIGRLYLMARAIIEAIDSTVAESGWSWISVGSALVDESTGTAFLAAPVRLQYRNGDPA